MAQYMHGQLLFSEIVLNFESRLFSHFVTWLPSQSVESYLSVCDSATIHTWYI